MLKINHQANVKGSAKQLQENASKMGISHTFTEDKIVEGWVNKPKGMKQVAFERGLLDVKNVTLYSKDGPKDDNNHVIDESFSLKCILSSCTDFVKEKTLLRHMGETAGKNLGINVTIDRSPKGHPEVAGEGIEYTWANAKFFLRTVPLEKRRSVEQFKQQVRLALSRDKGAMLSQEKIIRFSARARDYIAAYHHLHKASQPKTKDNTASPHSTTLTTLKMKDIERMKRTYRSHRGVERCDTGYCTSAALVILNCATVKTE